LVPQNETPTKKLSNSLEKQTMVMFDAAAVNQRSTEFENLGHIMRRNKPCATPGMHTADRRFRGWFGVSSMVAAKTWLLLAEDTSFDQTVGSMNHLLWAFMLLKDYGNVESLASNAGSNGVDEKTFSRHAWEYVLLMSDLEADVVSCCVVVI
jgi:hypothetical protein